MKIWKSMVLVLLTLFLCAGALAEEAWPLLNEAGFYEGGEYIYVNEDDGVWQYADDTLRVQILRQTTTNPKRIWYEAEVWATPGENWYLALATEGKHLSTASWPYLVAQKNGTVLSINNDYAQGRYPSKNKAVGIIVRDSKVFWSKTRKASYRGFPNLDTLALFPDGNMMVFDSDEVAAEDYLAMGATDVLSFGPYLIRDGVMNEEGFSLAKGNAPRTAIGMVEPGHYWAMMLEGRSKNSKGGPIAFLAERMLEKGCTTAFNLDGGETACMLFMGKQINVVGGTKNKGGNARRSTELLSIGFSAQVEGYVPPKESK